MTSIFQNIIWVALGGAIGSVLRYSITLFFKQMGWEHLPLGTLAVNVIGSIGIGIFYAFSSKNLPVEHLKPLVVIGILGGFTTFSSYISDTFLLMEKETLAIALSYFVITLLLGGLGFILGYKLYIKI